jgi:ankyrin repeat protein
MARTLLAISVLALIAASCGPGPLPTPPAHEDPLQDRFPSTSADPRDLDIAIRSDKLEDVRRLLDAGADPNARWGLRGDCHPLQEAIEPYWGSVTHRTEIVQRLLEHGADPNLRWCPFESRGGGDGWIGCRSAVGLTPLMAAAAYDMTEIVELLLDAGADPKLRDWNGASALDYLPGEIAFELISRKLFPRISTRNQEALASLRQYSGAGPDNPRNATPLSRAISQTGTSLTPPPPPPPTVNGAVNPAWLFGRRSANPVRLLLNLGADPNERVTPDWVDWTPVALAIGNNQPWMLRALLDAGADPNARWCFVLDWEFGNKVRQKNPQCDHGNGTTALMLAASMERATFIPVLLAYGADPSLTNWNGKSAADLAATDEIRALLSQRHP